MEELSPRGLEMHLIFLLPAATIHVFAPTCLHPLSCLRAASPMGQGKHHSVPPGSSLLWLMSAMLVPARCSGQGVQMCPQ